MQALLFVVVTAVDVIPESLVNTSFGGLFFLVRCLQNLESLVGQGF
jgi:hypothetical protein